MKIGFRDAIAVRWQEPGRDDFDPEDINYCTFRWITTNMTYAMSCLRSNPLTGEMIDGDVIFDASWIFAPGSRNTRFSPAPIPTAAALLGMARPAARRFPLAVGQILSPDLQAAKEGFRPADPAASSAAAGLVAESARTVQPRADLIPSGWNEMDLHPPQRQAASHSNMAVSSVMGCVPELGLAALAIAADDDDEKDDADDKSKEKERGKGKRRREDKDKKKDDEIGKHPRRVDRPTHQGGGHARASGTRWAFATQLQGEHHADRRAAQRHVKSPGSRA